MVSEKVADAAYNCAWYSDTLSFQKSLIFIIVRAQKQVVLEVGPFGTLSLEFLGWVVQTAYSYLTILLQAYD
ncbi:Odorant receptor Or2 [Blattella germanica]|nr:Odorant receptor Or2 [Blattella germanica]